MSDERKVIPLRALADRETVAVQPCWTVPELPPTFRSARVRSQHGFVRGDYEHIGSQQR